MPTKWQRFKVNIPESYRPVEREAIAQDIIDFVVERTLKRKDKNNRTFTPGYSESYANSRAGRLAGKKQGQAPNLRLEGDMLEALGDYLRHRKGEITIGYEKGTEENDKADGNVRGTYGNSKPIMKGRNFMGITKKDLKTILRRYPLRGEDAKKQRLKSALKTVTTEEERQKVRERFGED